LHFAGKVMKTIPADRADNRFPATLSFAPDSKQFVYASGGAIFLDTLE
jgi:hypothetical protein